MPKLLTGKEVAQRRRCSPDKVRLERQQDPYTGPPYLKDGRTVLYPEPELDAWLEARLVGTDPAA